MNHVLLFLYILLITGGTGGVVALALLHSRLRTPITASFLVANAGLLAALLLALVSFYVDTVIVDGSAASLSRTGDVRTVLGFIFGVGIYAGLTGALTRLPGAPRGVVVGLGAVVVVAMAVQGGLILAGRLALAGRSAPLYLLLVSASLLGFGTLMIRHGRSAPSPTMAWLITRLGWFTAAYALVSTLVYALIPFELRLDFLYYLGWSILSISSFVRYMTRPTTLDESEELSRAFVANFGITAREEEIVRLVGQGLSNQEIADRLGISFGTVRTHVYNIFQKTGAGSRVDLLRLVRGYRE